MAAPPAPHVALFGGSFNPPHVGHLLAAAYVRAVTDVDAVWLMPAFVHPFGKELAPFDARVGMCAALAAQLTGVEVSRVEEEVGADGRTIRTVEHLLARWPGTRFSLVVGADIVAEWHRWMEFERLAELARPIVLGRTGFSPPEHVTGPLAKALFLWDVPMPRVSSTDVRDRLAAGSAVDHLVPRAVLKEIRERGLYRRP